MSCLIKKSGFKGKKYAVLDEKLEFYYYVENRPITDKERGRGYLYVPTVKNVMLSIKVLGIVKQCEIKESIVEISVKYPIPDSVIDGIKEFYELKYPNDQIKVIIYGES